MLIIEYCLCMDFYGGNYNIVCLQLDVVDILQLNIYVVCFIKVKNMYIQKM